MSGDHNANQKPRSFVDGDWPQCVCGEPWRLNSVHREKLPCFHYIEPKWINLTDEEIIRASVDPEVAERVLNTPRHQDLNGFIEGAKQELIESGRGIGALLKEKNT